MLSALSCFGQGFDYSEFFQSRSITTASGPSNITSGLVAWWPFDGTNGTNPTNTPDLSANANSASLVNSPLLVTGKITNCFQFNGAISYLKATEISAIKSLGGNSFTITAWSSNAATATALSGSYQRALSWYDGTYNVQFGAGSYGVSGTQCYYIVMTNAVAATPSALAFTTNIYNSNQWHWIAVTVSGFTANMYVDGANVTSNNPAPSAMQPGLFSGDSSYVYIAQRGNGAYFNGCLDDLRIYNRALSYGEITNLYEWPTGGRP
jgi:hypothetical protein